MPTSLSTGASTGRRAILVRGDAAAKVRRLPLTTQLLDGVVASVVDPEVIERARLEGFQTGYTDGHAAGLELAERAAAAGEAERFSRVSRAVGALQAAADDLRARQALELDEVGAALADAAFTIAEAVLAAELRLRDGGGLEAVRRALALAPTTGDVDLRLHPTDAAALDEAGLRDALVDRPHRVVADPAVAQGGCIAVIGACSVDAQLPAALERVRAELLGEGA